VQVAKKAIWAPERESDLFMNGDSPIGIATELGDLKIVSHGAVFDVVRQAWPGHHLQQLLPVLRQSRPAPHATSGRCVPRCSECRRPCHTFDCVRRRFCTCGMPVSSSCATRGG
jgi:hypothetical protein